MAVDTAVAVDMAVAVAMTIMAGRITRTTIVEVVGRKIGCPTTNIKPSSRPKLSKLKQGIHNISSDSKTTWLKSTRRKICSERLLSNRRKR